MCNIQISSLYLYADIKFISTYRYKVYIYIQIQSFNGFPPLPDSCRLICSSHVVCKYYLPFALIQSHAHIQCLVNLSTPRPVLPVLSYANSHLCFRAGQETLSSTGSHPSPLAPTVLLAQSFSSSSLLTISGRALCCTNFQRASFCKEPLFKNLHLFILFLCMQVFACMLVSVPHECTACRGHKRASTSWNWS